MTRTLSIRERARRLVDLVADGSRFDSHNPGDPEVSTMNLTDDFKVFGLDNEFLWLGLEPSMRFLSSF